MTLVSIVLFSVVLASIKLIGTRLPMTEILLIRQIIVLLIIVQFVKGRVRQALRTNNLVLQILAGAVFLGIATHAIRCMLYIPFAEVTALSFSQVIFITIAAAIILREISELAALARNHRRIFRRTDHFVADRRRA